MLHQRLVLVVEDDIEIASAVAATLAEGGFDAELAANMAEAKAAVTVATGRIDAVMLDVVLPDGEGWDLCAWMRNAGLDMPVIVLTGLDDEGSVVRALRAGANDYITKPFSGRVLLARLRAQLRNWDTSSTATIPLGPWFINCAARALVDRATGRKVPLTGKELAMLRRLLRDRGTTVSKGALLKEIWGYADGVETHTLETHVYRLRQKLEATPAMPELLLSVDGGYKIATESVVRRPPQPAAAPPAFGTLPEGTQTAA